MRIVVDPALCTGNTVCISVASDLLEMRDDNKAHVIRAEDLGPEYRSQVNQAVMMCPTQAITVEFD